MSPANAFSGPQTAWRIVPPWIAAVAKSRRRGDATRTEESAKLDKKRHLTLRRPVRTTQDAKILTHAVHRLTTLASP